MVEQEPPLQSEQPLGYVLRALYQQHPLKLSLFPLLSPEHNPQQINLECGLEAFGARFPCGQRQGEMSSYSLEVLSSAP